MSTENMTEAEKAYKAAQDLIAEVIRGGGNKVDCGGGEFRELTSIPPDIVQVKNLLIFDFSRTQISDLSPLESMPSVGFLGLANTQVSDLTPIAHMREITDLMLTSSRVTDLSAIAGLTRLQVLSLRDTDVADLTPLLGMSKLIDDPEATGLTFTNTAATRNDPKIREISEIEDHSERARTLFEYLESQQYKDTLEPDSISHVGLHNGQLDVDAATPAANDALKQALHQRLRTSASSLASAAGNQFPRLCATARSLLKEAEKPFADIDLVTLFLDNEALNDWEAAGAEDDQTFPPEVTIPLAEVARAAAGLTLGDPQIDILVERINRSKGTTAPANEVARQSDMAEVLKNDPAAVGERLRHQQVQLDVLSTHVAHLVRKPTMKNVLLAIAGTLATGVATSALSPPIIAMVQANWPIFAAAAETYSLHMLHYFASSFTQVPEIAAQAKTTLANMKKRRQN